MVCRLSESEKAEIWDRFEAGESSRSISPAFGKALSSIWTHVVTAGFRPPLPDGEWSSRRLSLAEREEISRGLTVGHTDRQVKDTTSPGWGDSPAHIEASLCASSTTSGSAPASRTAAARFIGEFSILRDDTFLPPDPRSPPPTGTDAKQYPGT